MKLLEQPTAAIAVAAAFLSIDTAGAQSEAGGNALTIYSTARPGGWCSSAQTAACRSFRTTPA